jgi:hypothetical protein
MRVLRCSSARRHVEAQPVMKGRRPLRIGMGDSMQRIVRTTDVQGRNGPWTLHTADTTFCATE